ncbi:MAG: NAD(P)-binding protein, partial [Acidimicrobiia bacterium]|nr:NAD(P)-binding protein [Acidimicrobiia bacterium]
MAADPMTPEGLLWTPLQIGATTVKNRIMLSPHRQAYGDDNQPTDRMIAYYVERAKGGVALVDGESTSVSRRLARASAESGPSGWRLTAWEERVIPAFARLAEALHAHDCKIFMEFSTFGVNQGARIDFDDWYPVRGPSRVPSPGGTEIPWEMDQEYIDELVEDYGRSAANMRRAGIDGVEVHAAHGYLPMQFLSPAFNKRTDRYGGSPRRNAQLLLEIGESIRAQVSDDYTVGMRFSFDEYIGDAGVTPELAEEYLDIFAATGFYDFFSISSGSYHSFHYAVPAMGSVPQAFLVDYGKHAKQVVGDRAKIFLAGRILDLATAERVIADGAADMVAMVRAHMADPFLITKTLEGREREIVRCVGANECLATGFRGRRMHCVMNPAVGREQRWGEGTLVPAAEPKRVAVVGAGPAGLMVAGVAARRGHEVTLFEERDDVGGHLDLLKRLPTRGDWQKMIDNLTRVADDTGVEVRLGTAAGSADLAGGQFDEVVCATGSVWDRSGLSGGRADRSGIPGADAPNVLDVATAIRRALDDPLALGAKVVVLDDCGAYLPLGLAEVLGSAGVDVEVISRFAVIGQHLVETLELPWMLPRLAAAGVTLTPNHFVEAIGERRVEVYTTWNKRTRIVEDVDTVVLAMLRSP